MPLNKILSALPLSEKISPSKTVAAPLTGQSKFSDLLKNTLSEIEKTGEVYQQNIKAHTEGKSDMIDLSKNISLLELEVKFVHTLVSKFTSTLKEITQQTPL